MSEQPTLTVESNLQAPANDSSHSKSFKAEQVSPRVRYVPEAPTNPDMDSNTQTNQPMVKLSFRRSRGQKVRAIVVKSMSN